MAFRHSICAIAIVAIAYFISAMTILADSTTLIMLWAVMSLVALFSYFTGVRNGRSGRSLVGNSESSDLKCEHEPETTPDRRARFFVETFDDSPESRHRAWDELENVCAESPVDSGGELLIRDQLHERS